MIVVPTIEQRLALAQAQVEWGRWLVAQRQQYVKEFRESGDTAAEKLLAAETLLAVLERTQNVFERDLANLEKQAASATATPEGLERESSKPQPP